jgi:hypothetical protein
MDSENLADKHNASATCSVRPLGILDILGILRMEQLTAYYLYLVGVSIHKRARCLHHLIPRPRPKRDLLSTFLSPHHPHRPLHNPLSHPPISR